MGAYSCRLDCLSLFGVLMNRARLLLALLVLFSVPAVHAATCEGVFISQTGAPVENYALAACNADGPSCAYQAAPFNSTNVCFSDAQTMLANVTGETYLGAVGWTRTGTCLTTSTTGRCFFEIQTTTAFAPIAGCEQVASGAISCPGVCVHNAAYLANNPLCVAPSAACDDYEPSIYSCSGTAGTLAEATSAAMQCQEGAYTSDGCALMPTVGGAPPACLQTSPTVAQGGTSSVTVQCGFDLTPDPEYELAPGESLPEVDGDAPIDEITQNQTEEESTDASGCVTTSSTTNSVVPTPGGMSTCRITTTSVSGGSCTAGSTVASTCTQTYADGSSTTDETLDIYDAVGGAGGSGTITGSSGSSTSTGPGQLADDAEEEAAEGTWSGGSCGTPPVCTGDVILCGMADVAYYDACGFVDDMDSFNATDALGPADQGPTLEVDVDSVMGGVMDAEGFFVSRSCPAPVSVVVMGQTLEWTFDALCSAFGILSYLILGFAALLSFRIVAEGF